MILVRNVFRLKFGKAKDAVAAWKEVTGVLTDLNFSTTPVRITTDLAGANFYTLVMESTHESMGDYEKKAAAIMGKPDWKNWYSKFAQLVESGHREIFNVVE